MQPTTMKAFLEPVRAPLARLLAAALLGLVLSAAVAAPAQAAARVKDIADFEGIRDNMLVGYGLVVGLNGTGDSLTNSVFTQQSLVSMLERLGVNTRDQTLKTENIAAVMVTATLPPFARQGSHIDVNVSSLGDATSLLGGTLLVTPLMGADGEVYAVGQGQVTVSGFSAKGQSGSSATKGVPTSGRIASGAIVEREVGFDLSQLRAIKLALRNPDLTTARRIAQAINAHFEAAVADPRDPSTVELAVPESYRNNVALYLSEVEQLMVEADQVAKVILDEKSGVIVMGQNVRVDEVAIAHGSLTIQISETPQVSQPGAFAPAGATTQVVQRSQINVDEGAEKHLAVLPRSVTLQELVTGLNALGIGPRDMIAILQAIKAAGALQAEIEVL